MAIIVILALATRTRIDFYEHLAIGAVAALVGFALYKVGHWSAGDVKLVGVVGLTFGAQTPYVALISALLMIGWYLVKKQATGLPLGAPVGVAVGVYTLISLWTA